MSKLLQNIAGMAGLTDQVIATDFLITAKSGVRNLAFALTETVTPELRAVLRKQLHDMIESHEKISHYFQEKGYCYPHNLNEQAKINLQTSETALQLAEKDN